MRQKAVAVLIKAIEPLPGLGGGRFRNQITKLVCALGALGLRSKTHTLVNNQAWQRAAKLGLAKYYQGWDLTNAGISVASVNDADDDEKPAARKKRVLAWLRAGAK